MRRKMPSSKRRKSVSPLRKVPSSPRRPNQPTPSSPTKRKSSSNTTKSPRKSLQNTTADVSRRTRRLKNGTKALREIRALQRTTRLLIPKASFCRVVKEIMNSFAYHDLRIQSTALEALQEAAEMYMIQFFEDSLLCCLHAKRVTLMPKDCHLMRRLRGPNEVCNK